MSSSTLYSKIVTPSRRDSAKHLNEFGHLLKWNDYKENILDFGCGDGFVTTQVLYPNIEKYTNTLLGIDFSESLINVAKSKNNIENIQFKVWDMANDDNLEEMTNRYDHIFSTNCMHWILDHRKLIERIYKMLTPTGQIFAATVADCSYHPALDVHLKNSPRWSKYLPKRNWFANYTNDPAKFMRNLLEEAGFVVDLCELRTITCPFIYNQSNSQSETTCTFQDFSRSIISLHPHLNSIPMDLRETFIQEFIEYSQKSCTPGKNPNECFWNYDSLILIASKQ